MAVGSPFSYAPVAAGVHSMAWVYWRRIFPQRIESLSDQFVSLNANARPELLTYARSARCGCVL
jgi:hypothetical protein